MPSAVLKYTFARCNLLGKKIKNYLKYQVGYNYHRTEEASFGLAPVAEKASLYLTQVA